MKINLSFNKSLLFGIIFFIYGCGADNSKERVDTSKEMTKAYMSDEDWKEFNENYSKSNIKIESVDPENCLPIQETEILELFKSSNRHDWLSSEGYKLVRTETTGNSGDVKKDISEYSNLWYQKCNVDMNNININKDGGEFYLKADTKADVSYTISYNDYLVAGNQFRLLSEEFKNKYKEVIYEPAKNNKNSSRKIYYIDDIFIFLNNGQTMNSIVLSRDPSLFVKNWKEDWRAGLYKIEGNPYELVTVKNTVPESIEGKDVHTYMSEKSDAVIIDLRSTQERLKGVPNFEGRVIHLPNNGFLFESNIHKLDKSKQYLLLSQTEDSKEAQQLAKDNGLTNFTRINGGFKAMVPQLFKE